MMNKKIAIIIALLFLCLFANADDANLTRDAAQQAFCKENPTDNLCVIVPINETTEDIRTRSVAELCPNYDYYLNEFGQSALIRYCQKYKGCPRCEGVGEINLTWIPAAILFAVLIVIVYYMLFMNRPKKMTQTMTSESSELGGRIFLSYAGDPKGIGYHGQIDGRDRGANNSNTYWIIKGPMDDPIPIRNVYFSEDEQDPNNDIILQSYDNAMVGNDVVFYCRVDLTGRRYSWNSKFAPKIPVIYRTLKARAEWETEKRFRKMLELINRLPSGSPVRKKSE